MDTKTIAIIGLIIGVIALGNYYHFNPNEIEKIVEIQPEEKAQIFTSFSDWAEELGNPNGYIFTYWVYNFGEVEAKDVVIECVVMDSNDNIIKRINKNFGNLASNSVEYDEMYTDLFENTIDVYGHCFTKSCSDCEVLEEKISELNKYLETN